MICQIRSIGTIRSDESGFFIQMEPMYIPGLRALDGFSHIQVLWWFSDCDNQRGRSVLDMKQPYKGAPETMGVFATRSPERPNPIALTTAEVIQIDFANGMIRLSFIDANDQTPVLDIKPYTPSFDRVETPGVPAWCNTWPKSMEEAGRFDWGNVFRFQEG